jgi:hypothetical protein
MSSDKYLSLRTKLSEALRLNATVLADATAQTPAIAEAQKALRNLQPPLDVARDRNKAAERTWESFKNVRAHSDSPEVARAVAEAQTEYMAALNAYIHAHAAWNAAQTALQTAKVGLVPFEDLGRSLDRVYQEFTGGHNRHPHIHADRWTPIWNAASRIAQSVAQQHPVIETLAEKGKRLAAARKAAEDMRAICASSPTQANTDALNVLLLNVSRAEEQQAAAQYDARDAVRAKQAIDRLLSAADAVIKELYNLSAYGTCCCWRCEERRNWRDIPNTGPV